MKHLFKPETHELEQAFQTIEDRFEFVWGVSGPYIEASLYTLNDIVIVYDTYDEVYMLELGTAYFL